MYLYDIALSYASEQERYVSRVYEFLKLHGLSVYFAPGNQEDITAENLVQVFYPIFHDQSMMIAAFVSKEYLKKDWTRQEVSIALTRSREEKRNCLIPICFGAARVPGMDPDIHYLNAEKSEAEIAYFLAEKVKRRKKEFAAATVPSEKSGVDGSRKDCTFSPVVHAGGDVYITQASEIKNSNIQCGQMRKHKKGK